MFLSSPQFWMETMERSIKTAAQTLVAILSVGGTGLLDVDWASAISVGGMGFLLSVLTCIGSAGVKNENSPSLVATGAGGGGAAVVDDLPPAAPAAGA